MLPANALLQCSWYRCQTLYKSSAAFLQQYQLSRCKSGSSSSIREALIVFYFIQNSETPNLILDAPIFSYASSSTLYSLHWSMTGHSVGRPDWFRGSCVAHLSVHPVAGLYLVTPECSEVSPALGLDVNCRSDARPRHALCPKRSDWLQYFMSDQ